MLSAQRWRREKNSKGGDMQQAGKACHLNATYGGHKSAHKAE
jgi:hypothetical protein